MDYRLRQHIEGNLPSNMKLDGYFVPPRLPQILSISLQTPSGYYIQVATRRGFLGALRGWETIGEIPDKEDTVYLWKKCYEEYLPIFKKVVGRFSGQIPIKPA